uniref:Choice-of-anchor C family protein n=1 Tax=Anaerolinea thermolimosa TaxID=229919 RepID=A0A7C4KIK9_9CHLR
MDPPPPPPSAFQNGSFESGTNPGSYLTVTAPNNTTITGWSVVSADIDYIGSFWSAADGVRSIDLSGNIGSAGAIQQTFATSAGATYYITFSLAGNPSGSPTIKTVQVSASPCAGCSPQNFTFDTTGRSLASMGWVDATYSFLATGASTTITFTSLDSTGYGPAIDNVRASYTPPPPPPITSTGANLNVMLSLAFLSILGGIFIFRKFRAA